MKGLDLDADHERLHHDVPRNQLRYRLGFYERMPQGPKTKVNFKNHKCVLEFPMLLTYDRQFPCDEEHRYTCELLLLWSTQQQLHLCFFPHDSVISQRTKPKREHKKADKKRTSACSRIMSFNSFHSILKFKLVTYTILSEFGLNLRSVTEPSKRNYETLLH
jgi:hypothetical protein